MSLSPSEAVELTVSSLSDKGEGLAQHQGYTCFMQDALPGERLQVRLGAPFVPNSRRRPAFIEQRLTTHPQRVPPFCPYYGRCGGCTLQTASLPLQHGLKQELIAKALRECGVGEDKLLSLYADAARPCRFKSIRRFATDAKGQLYSGFYQVRSHELTALTHCPLEPAWMGDFSAALTQVAQVQQLTAYQESSGRGCLRALLMREGDPGERLVLIVHADALPSAFIAAVQGLAAAHKIGCVACSCNRSRGNAVLGQSAEIIAGREVIYKTYGRLRFAFAPLAFMQVNHPICEQLYQTAVAYCGSGERALDLCCGSGTMSLLLALQFKQVRGVEIVPSAVAAAQANAAANQLTNADFVCADVRTFLQQEIAARQRVDALIADPARAGLGAANCQALNLLRGPIKAAFIFCALTALQRDLPLLLQGGWELEAVRGFDMFPYSLHVETLVLLRKKA